MVQYRSEDTVSYTHLSKEVPVKGNVANVVLEDATQELNEVVVTALGIKRSEKALSYNVQQLSGDELTTVKDAKDVYKRQY